MESPFFAKKGRSEIVKNQDEYFQIFNFFIQRCYYDMHLCLVKVSALSEYKYTYFLVKLFRGNEYLVLSVPQNLAGSIQLEVFSKSRALKVSEKFSESKFLYNY